jgi:hypothetical protein
MKDMYKAESLEAEGCAVPAPFRGISAVRFCSFEGARGDIFWFIGDEYCHFLRCWGGDERMDKEGESMG